MNQARRRSFWLVTFAAALGMAVTGALGFWQLSRAAQKQQLQEQIDSRRAEPALSNAQFAALQTQPNLALHRQVQLSGHWLSQYTVYLDNRQMQGRPGFYVYTPLALDNGQGVVLVQRGWVPRHFTDRTQLPPVDTSTKPVSILARVAAAPARLYEFAVSASTPAPQGWELIRQNLDLGALRLQTGLPLYELTAVQLGPNSEGLQRDWPEVGTGVAMHRGYAFQWFALAGLIFLLYVWFQFITKRVSRA